MNANIVPISLNANSGSKIDIAHDEIEECSFGELAAPFEGQPVKLDESDLEEFVRKNPGLFFQDDETLLIVGQQVRDKIGKRSDLVAIDAKGNIVYIELKRDHGDMAVRKEPLEFQAVRYAANYARIESRDKLVELLFGQYVEKHRSEFSKKEGKANQVAKDCLDEFLDNVSHDDFNEKQRIVLIAASFDEESRSACAWLAKNGIDLRCLTVNPFKYGQQVFLAIETIIPPPKIESFYVDVAQPTQIGKKVSKGESAASKESLPRIPKLFEWGLIKAGDKVYIKTQQEEIAEVLDSKRVRYKGQSMSFNEWGRLVTGWSAINVYEWTVVEGSKRTLDELRAEKLEALKNAL